MISFKRWLRKKKLVKELHRLPGAWLYSNDEFYKGLNTLVSFSSEPISFFEKTFQMAREIPEKSTLNKIETELADVFHYFRNSGFEFENSNFKNLSNYSVVSYRELLEWSDQWHAKLQFRESIADVSAILKLHTRIKQVNINDKTPGIHHLKSDYNRISADVKYLIHLSIVNNLAKSKITILLTTFEELKLRVEALLKNLETWQHLHDKCRKACEMYSLKIKADSGHGWFLKPVIQFVQSPDLSLQSQQQLEKYLEEINAQLDKKPIEEIQLSKDSFIPSVYNKYPELEDFSIHQDNPLQHSRSLVARADKLLFLSMDRFLSMKTSGFDVDDFQVMTLLRNPHLSINDFELKLNNFADSYEYTGVIRRFLRGEFALKIMLYDKFGRKKLSLLKSLDLYESWLRNPENGFPKEIGAEWVKELVKNHLKTLPRERLITDTSWDKHLFEFLLREPDFKSYANDYVFEKWSELSDSIKQDVFSRLSSANKNEIIERLMVRFIKKSDLFDDLLSLINVVHYKKRPVLFRSILKSCSFIERSHISRIVSTSSESSLRSYIKVISDSYQNDLLLSTKLSISDLIVDLLPSLDALSHISSNELLEALCGDLSKRNDPQDFSVLSECVSLFLKRGYNTEYIALYFNPAILLSTEFDFTESQWRIIGNALRNQNNYDYNRLEESVLKSQCRNIPDQIHSLILKSWQNKGEEYVCRLDVKQIRYLGFLKSAFSSSHAYLADLLYYAHKFFSNRISASEVPDEVLQI
jgi:hypothetical protein